MDINGTADVRQILLRNVVRTSVTGRRPSAVHRSAVERRSVAEQRDCHTAASYFTILASDDDDDDDVHLPSPHRHLDTVTSLRLSTVVVDVVVSVADWTHAEHYCCE